MSDLWWYEISKNDLAAAVDDKRDIDELLRYYKNTTTPNGNVLLYGEGKLPLVFKLMSNSLWKRGAKESITVEGG